MKWLRYRNARGQIYYTVAISETIMIHVWEDRGWNWIIAGWPSKDGPKIFRHGRGKTLKDVTRQVEDVLPKNDEQLVWMNL